MAFLSIGTDIFLSGGSQLTFRIFSSQKRLEETMNSAALFQSMLYRRYRSGKSIETAIWFKRLAAVLIFLTCYIVAMGNHPVYAESDDALFIDEKGNVGVGTNQPQERLDVKGNVRAEKYTGDGSSIEVRVPEINPYGNQSSQSLKDWIADIISNMIPVGTIMAYGGDLKNNAVKKDLERRGWLVCNGETVSCEEYRELFEVTNNYYTEGQNTAVSKVCQGNFHLPDIRGRFLRGVNYDAADNNGAPRDPGCRQQNNCDKVGLIQEDTFKQHSHKYRTNIWFWKEGKSGGHYVRGDHTTNSLHEDRTADEGNAETRPKNIHVNWIIKAKYRN
jgi:hypothetical protein